MLVADGGILEDFIEADLSVLRLIVKHLGPLCIPAPLLPKVTKLNGGGCRRLGMEVAECTTEQLLEAGCRRPGLSFEDRICLILARDSNSTCVTNEAVLQKACIQNGVATLCGPDLVAELRRQVRISSEKAGKVLRSLHAINPDHISRNIIMRYQHIIGGLP